MLRLSVLTLIATMLLAAVPGVAVLSAAAQVATPAPTTPPPPAILSPAPGQALQGVIAIVGSSAVEGFRAAELTFGYANDPTHTWFFIAESTAPVANGTLGEWDTTTLTDGNYTLRLVVYRADGSQLAVTVPGLRVRNYSPIETSTPAPTLTPTITPTIDPSSLPTATPSLTPSPSPLPSITPTLTPLPTNPAVVASHDIALSLGRGAMGGLGVFVLLGVYLAVRRLAARKT